MNETKKNTINSTISKLSILLICSLGFLGCQKDFTFDGSLTPTPPINSSGYVYPAATPITGSVSGLIVDENQNPLQNAEVKIANSSFYTNAAGKFTTNNITLDKYVTTVKVIKQGYFIGYRSFLANNTKNYVNIQLLTKNLSSSFNSTTSTTVGLSNGTQLTFLANSIVIKSTNTAYNGVVNVYVKYIDPTSTTISKTLPGCFVGVDAGKLFALKSKGMIAVDLESPTGEPLQLSTTKPVTIKLPIPTTLQSTAPNSIATWSLNEQGIWQKEGTATKVGNYYEFLASHFSFWNVDIPVDVVLLSINVKNQIGQNVPQAFVALLSTSNAGFGATYGITDSLGNVSGFVPKNEQFTLQVQYATINCGTPLYTQQIGPYAVNTSINVVATLPATQILTVKGTTTNCANSPTEMGIVYIQKENDSLNTIIANVVNGNFSIDIPYCTPLSQITVKTYAGVLPQQPQAFVFNVSGNVLNAGNLTLCDSAYSGFVKYKIDNTNYVRVEERNVTFFAALYNQTSNNTTLYAGTNGSTTYLNPTALGTTVGTFAYDINSLLEVEQYVNGNVVNASATITFDTYGNTGEYVTGSFNIPFTDANSIAHSFTGTFKLRRQ